jgi:hypothetical protein
MDENMALVEKQHTGEIVSDASSARGIFSLNREDFELGMRQAKAIASSEIVPTSYKNNIPSCMIALDMAQRMNCSVMVVVQNLNVIHGRPAWGSQFLISLVNQSGLYDVLKWEWRGEEGNDNWGARAYTRERKTGNMVYGTWVDIKMAKAEGWYSRNGSKWQTMPEQMLMYRAGAFFAKMYAGHLISGLPSVDEVIDQPTATIVNINEPKQRSSTPDAEIELAARETKKKKAEAAEKKEPPKTEQDTIEVEF